MFTDLTGKTRLKINTHTHTTASDGRKTTAEAAALYRAAEYDILAITDHWVVSDNSFIEDKAVPEKPGITGGITLLRGCEYNNVAAVRDGVFHIVGIGMERELSLVKGEASTQEIIDEINAAGGAAILAHPAWSLNQIEHIMALRGLAALEIYNTVSNVENSARPDSSSIADLLACRGYFLPLIAADDTHYYTEGGDLTVCSAMLETGCPPDGRPEPRDIVRAIKDGKFYATQGPEIHVRREGEIIYAQSSPAESIVFLSDTLWTPDRANRRKPGGKSVTEAEYKIKPTDSFVRAEATDSFGRVAWTGYILVNN